MFVPSEQRKEYENGEDVFVNDSSDDDEDRGIFAVSMPKFPGVDGNASSDDDGSPAADDEEAAAEREAIGLPVLIVDLHRFTSGRIASLANDERAAMRRAFLEMLSGSDFRLRSAHLFASGFAFHSDTLSVEEDVAAIRHAFGGRCELMSLCVFFFFFFFCLTHSFPKAYLYIIRTTPAVIPYPREINKLPVALLWSAVCRATDDSVVVNEIKTFVRDAQGDLQWKADLCVEIEKLAAQEAAAAETRDVAVARCLELKAQRERVAERLVPGLSAEDKDEIRAELDVLGKSCTALEDLALDESDELPEGEVSLLEYLLDSVATRHSFVGPRDATEEAEIREHRQKSNKNNQGSNNDDDDDDSIMSRAEHDSYIAATQFALVETWRREFGRLPRASEALRTAMKREAVKSGSEMPEVFDPWGADEQRQQQQGQQGQQGQQHDQQDQIVGMEEPIRGGGKRPNAQDTGPVPEAWDDDEEN
jgi:hypothetical protein